MLRVGFYRQTLQARSRETRLPNLHTGDSLFSPGPSGLPTLYLHCLGFQLLLISDPAPAAALICLVYSDSSPIRDQVLLGLHSGHSLGTRSHLWNPEIDTWACFGAGPEAQINNQSASPSAQQHDATPQMTASLTRGRAPSSTQNETTKNPSQGQGAPHGEVVRALPWRQTPACGTLSKLVPCIYSPANLPRSANCSEVRAVCGLCLRREGHEASSRATALT